MKIIAKENEINKLIRQQRSTGYREYILFTSLWEETSSSIMCALKKSPPKVSLSIVNSFDAPHSFVIWGVKKTPCLVILDGRGKNKRTLVTDHATDIYKKLKLER